MKSIIIIMLTVIVGLCSEIERTDAPIENDTTPTEKLTLIVNNLTPENWIIYNKVKHFTPENLYEQINGRAEYYIAYDVKGLTFASFEKKSDNTTFIDLSIYDMITPLNAFGVFSGERSIGSDYIDLGRDGYRSGASYFIWHGQYYIQIIAPDTLAEFKTIGLEIAKKLTGTLSDSGEPVWGLTALPEENRVPQSIQYFAVDALGLNFMQNTYTAKYQHGESLVSVFMSNKNSPESAQKTVEQYAGYANKYGKGIKQISKDRISMFLCQMGHDYDIIFQKGSLLAGVSGVEDKEIAIKVAIDLWSQLE